MYKAYDHISSILVRHKLRWTNHPIRGIYPVPTEEIIKVVQRLSPRLCYCISIWYNQKFLKCYKNMKKMDTKSKSELKQTFISTENIIMKVEQFQEKVMFWKALKKRLFSLLSDLPTISHNNTMDIIPGICPWKFWQLLTIHRHFTFTFKHLSCDFEKTTITTMYHGRWFAYMIVISWMNIAETCMQIIWRAVLSSSHHAVHCCHHSVSIARSRL